jgi:hypothetical protein
MLFHMLLVDGVVKLNSVKTFIDSYCQCIKKSDINEALDLSVTLGTILWNNNLGIYSLHELEVYLIKLAEESLDYSLVEKQLFSDKGAGYLFVATELYLTGGHTRLLENLSTFIGFTTVDLFVKDKVDTEIFKRESVYFSNILTLDDIGESQAEKILKMVSVFIRYEHIFLNLHPNDIVTVVACALAKKINKSMKVYFVNHADHVFSYGVAIADVWYEISLYGIKLDECRELTADKSFLGIPVKTANYKSVNQNFVNGDLILTAASNCKYKPTANGSLIPLLDLLLSSYPNSKCQVIGVDKYRAYWWWYLKLKYTNRLILSYSLPYEEYLKAAGKAVLYIDSHPFPGGTAFVEQFLNGKICTGLISPYQGYTPLEKTKKSNLAEVVTDLEVIDLESYNRLVKDVIVVHSHEQVKDRFVKSLFNQYTSYDDLKIDSLGLTSFDLNIITSDRISAIPDDLSMRNVRIFMLVIRFSNVKAIGLFFLKRLFSRIRSVV